MSNIFENIGFVPFFRMARWRPRKVFEMVFGGNGIWVLFINILDFWEFFVCKLKDSGFICIKSGEIYPILPVFTAFSFVKPLMLLKSVEIFENYLLELP